MARKQPYRKKSRPNICSMFLQGACTRGAACPYRHEIPANHQSTPSEETTTLWVGGVTDAVSESDLRKEMSQYGTIQEIRMLCEKTCAFVEFKSRDEAKKALESSTGRVLNGSKLSFNWAKSSSTSSTSSHNKKKGTVPTATTNTSSLPVSSLVVPASQSAVSKESVPQGFQVAPSVRKILKEKSRQDVPPPPPPPRHNKYPSTSSNAMGSSSSSS